MTCAADGTVRVWDCPPCCAMQGRHGTAMGQPRDSMDYMEQPLQCPEMLSDAMASLLADADEPAESGRSDSDHSPSKNTLWSQLWSAPPACNSGCSLHARGNRLSSRQVRWVLGGRDCELEAAHRRNRASQCSRQGRHRQQRAVDSGNDRLFWVPLRGPTSPVPLAQASLGQPEPECAFIPSSTPSPRGVPKVLMQCSHRMICTHR